MSGHKVCLSLKQWISVVAVTLLFFTSNLNAKSLKSDSLFKATPLVQPNEELRVHRASNLWLSITNFGNLGGLGIFPHFDPETNQPAPYAMFPAGSGLEYLFQGALWIGAIVKGETLVSVGEDGWESTTELHPDTVGIVKRPLLADNEFIAVFTDTITDPHFTPPDPFDGPHRPLGIEITQHSYSWISPPFNDFVILDYKIKNINNPKNRKHKTLSNVYIGIYIDGDVHNPNLDPAGYTDDVTGFQKKYVFGKTDTLNDIAWIADNDGLASNRTSSFDSTSPLGVLGIKLLGSSLPIQKKSYNWWFSSDSSVFDFGPWTLADSLLRPELFPGRSGNVLGTPSGDKAKYFILQNGEIDYDQIYLPIDHTDEGWLLPPFSGSTLIEFANGWDTRFLYSFGGFNLAPGDSATFAIAVVAGDSMHRDPSHFNFKFPYQALYFFDDLAFNVIKAQDAYNSGYTLPAPGPPANFEDKNLPGNKTLLTWAKKEAIDFQGYNLYRSTISGNYSEPLNQNLITDTLYVDTNLTEADTYYYTVACVDSQGNSGIKSKEISVLGGRPNPPSGLNTKTANGLVNLVWNRHPEEDVYKFNIYRTQDKVNFTLLDSVALDTVYTDNTVQNGTIYYYRITATDFFNLESFPTDTVYALPMAFDQGILIVDETNDMWVGKFDTTEVNSFYQSLFETDTVAYWNNLPFSLTLTSLSPYPIVVLHSEDINPSDLATMGLLKDYARAGGKILMVGNRGIVKVGESSNYGGFFNFKNNSFGYQFLHLASGYQPSVYVKQFIGAKSQKEGYPDLEVDPVKADSLFPNFYGDNFGRLLLVGYFVPRDTAAQILYTFVAADSDTATFDTLNAQPCGMLIKNSTYQAVFLDFPLFFLTYASASALVQKIIAEFNQPTDVKLKDPRSASYKTYVLQQNYPNPFNQTTNIVYNLPQGSFVNLTIYNLLGQKIKTLLDEKQTPGLKTIAWDGKDSQGKTVSSGIYFYRLKTEKFEESKKMLLLK